MRATAAASWKPSTKVAGNNAAVDDARACKLVSEATRRKEALFDGAAVRQRTARNATSIRPRAGDCRHVDVCYNLWCAARRGHPRGGFGVDRRQSRGALPYF